MHNVSGSSADPYAQVCMCTRSLETELLTLPFSCLGEKAPGTVVGDFTRDGSQGSTPSG